MRQQFGGAWTEAKLQALEDYLKAYMTIMRGNPGAQNFRTIYLDGFAGSGRRYAESGNSKQGFLEGFQEPDTLGFCKGSVRRALELEKPFDEYIFVENDKQYTVTLEALREEFPQRYIRIVNTDANEFIPGWCSKMGPYDRALVFLDPYGMQVKWDTVKALAETQKVDMWVLVPIGQAIIRLLPQGEPPEEWSTVLTQFFGTEQWREHFYPLTQETTLFGLEEGARREVNTERVTAYIVKRLETVFCSVLKTPVILRDTRGILLYILCFGVSNPRGRVPAIRIAQDIARKFNDGN